MTDCSESDRIVDALDAKRSISADKSGRGEGGTGENCLQAAIALVVEELQSHSFEGQSEA